MARFVYIDESGSTGRGAKKQPFLIVVAAIVDEEMVQPLSKGLRHVAFKHLGWLPADFEFHAGALGEGLRR